MTSAYWDTSYPPEIYDDEPTEPAPVTGAAAGTPGTWTPDDAQVPGTLAELLAADPPVVASPVEAWAAGEYVEVGGGQAVHWDGATWQAGPAPEPDPGE